MRVWEVLSEQDGPEARQLKKIIKDRTRKTNAANKYQAAMRSAKKAENDVKNKIFKASEKYRQSLAS